MKEKFYNSVDLSSQIEKIEKGYGFYSSFMKEHKKNLSPARKMLNELKELFTLLCSPAAEGAESNGQVVKIVTLAKRLEGLFGSLAEGEYIVKLKKRISKICDDMRHKSEGGDAPLPTALFEDISPDERLDDGQKNVIYNMLLANGVSHEEAMNELLKY